MISADGERYRETGLGWPDAMAAVGPAARVAARERVRAGPGRAPGGALAGRLLESGLEFRLGRVYRMLRDDWETVIADLGVNAPQAALLRAVAERPGSELGELAQWMHTDAMNAGRLAEHLERAGLVSAACDPGHRQRRVLWPAGNGSAVAGELARRAAVQDSRVAGLLGSADLACLHRPLDHLESVLASGRLQTSGLEWDKEASQETGGGHEPPS
jgi:DNA-binding MarR family transcriptional regulator